MLAKAKQNLSATREADEDDKQKIITDITEPTPGAVVKDYFDDEDQNDQFITNTDNPVELNDYDKKTPLLTTKSENDDINPLNFTDEMPPVLNVPEIDFEDEPTKTTVPVVPPDYTYYPNNPPEVILDDDDVKFEKPKTEPEDFFIDDNEIMIELPEEANVGDKFTTTPATTEIKTEVFDDGQKIVQKNTKGGEKTKIKSGKKIKNRPNPYGKKNKS